VGSRQVSSDLASVKELAGQRKWSLAAVRGGDGHGRKTARVSDVNESEGKDTDGASILEEEKDMLRRIVEARRHEEMRRALSSSSRMSDHTNGTVGAGQVMPLVLLHVSILPCAMPSYSREALDAHAPKFVIDNYHLLREKLGDAVLARGVLIPHPGEEYDVLEERLLEALELCTPRILGCGHFYADDDAEVERELLKRPQGSSAMQEEGQRAICNFAHVEKTTTEIDDDENDVCETCAEHIRLPSAGVGRGTRRWDVKFFAANGLMRAGAWSAAWREMERVDVEISPWMPQEVKRALDQTLEEEHKAAMEEQCERQMQMDMLKMEAVNAQQRAQELEDKLRTTELQKEAIEEKTNALKAKKAINSQTTSPEAYPNKEDLQTLGNDIPLSHLLRNYIYIVSQDKRNIAVAVLSVLVLLISIFVGGRTTTETLILQPGISSSCIPNQHTISSISVASSVSAVSQERTPTTDLPMPSTVSSHSADSIVATISVNVGEPNVDSAGDTTATRDKMQLQSRPTGFAESMILEV
jgi:hypothetical protein